MSPKAPDPQVRRALIETAAKLLARGGRPALSTRRLAVEVGTSTMAVYTHFGGMDELHRAVRTEGFERLLEHLRSVEETDDPIADLAALGWAYCFNALANPQLYRAIFLEAPIDGDDDVLARATFEQLSTGVERAIAAGRFRPAPPEAVATQLWTAAHGMICAVLARVFTLQQLTEQLPAMARNLCVGFGDDPDAAGSSIERAALRMQPPASARRLT
jgi:AcrR family transcriptional regulator